VTDGEQSLTLWEKSVTDGFMSVTHWEQSLTDWQQSVINGKQSVTDMKQSDSLRGGNFGPFVAAGVAEIAEPAFFQGAVRQLQRDLRRPAGLGFGHARYHAHDAGNLVDHDFAEKAFAGGGIFNFGHAPVCPKNPPHSMAESIQEKGA